MRLLEEAPPLTSEPNVVSLAYYQDWLKILILKQKTAPSPVVVRWLAAALTMKIPPSWRSLPLVWLPGSPWTSIHLVEALALELHARGQPLTTRPMLVRRILPGKAQKELTLEERQSRDIGEIYRTVPRKWIPESCRPASGRRDAPLPNFTQKVVLLDDVITTGSTLRGCRRLLRERLGVEVAGSVTLAFTAKTLRQPTRH